MIRVVTGTPGAGKSCYAVAEIVAALQDGKTVATNIALAPDFAERLARRHPRTLRIPALVRKKAAEYRSRYVVLDEPSDLRRVWPINPVEGGCLVVIDEAHALLDSRDFKNPERQEWIVWLTQHRKLGLDLLFVVQHFEMLDTNVRRLVEWEIRLRDLRRARAYGIPVPLPFSVAHWFWATMQKSQRTQVFRPRSVYGLYSTTATLHGVSHARPDGAIVLPAPRPAAQAKRRPDALPEHGRPGTPEGTPQNTGDEGATTPPSPRVGALPAPLDGER